MSAGQYRRRGRGPLLALPLMVLLSGCMGVAGQQLDALSLGSAPASTGLQAGDAMALFASPATQSPRSGTSVAAPGVSRREAPGDAGKQSDSVGFSLASLKRRLDAAFTPDQPSPAERQRLGDALARKVLAGVRLSTDPALRKRIEGIVARLARAVPPDQRFPSRWRVYVIDDSRADAFTSGGGHLFITTGMIDLLQTDERIATVLAHEMAHNLLAHVWAAKEKKDMARRAHRYAREVLTRRMRMPWLGKSVSFVVDASLNTYSRQQEYDADAEGLDLLVRAGYRPQAALETFEYLQRRFREQPDLENFFYSNHPLYHRRRWYLANRIRAHYRKQAGLPPVRHANWKSRWQKDNQ